MILAIHSQYQQCIHDISDMHIHDSSDSGFFETRGVHPHEWKLKINIFNFFFTKMTDSQDFAECPCS